jgi:hypothetical protein
MMRAPRSSLEQALSSTSHSPDVKCIHVEEEEGPVVTVLPEEEATMLTLVPIVAVLPEVEETMRALGPLSWSMTRALHHPW